VRGKKRRICRLEFVVGFVFDVEFGFVLILVKIWIRFDFGENLDSFETV
jgi:hypothetical protein